MSNPMKNMSNGPEAAKSERQRKAATSSARGTKQPKGSTNPQHSKATKKSRKEKNLTNSIDMEF